MSRSCGSFHAYDDPLGAATEMVGAAGPLDRIGVLFADEGQRGEDGEEADGVHHETGTRCRRAAMTRPAIAGPMIREPLKRPELRATAFGSYAGPTIWNVSDWRPGRVERERDAAERREHVDDGKGRRVR